MEWLLILVSFCGITHNQNEVKERVDLIELNHFYDDLCRPAYDQVILYEWSPDHRRFDVIAWALIDNLEKAPHQLAGSGQWEVRWYDVDHKVFRVVGARLYRETWSQVDPERENKKLMPEKHRVGLMQIRRER